MRLSSWDKTNGISCPGSSAVFGSSTETIKCILAPDFWALFKIYCDCVILVCRTGVFCPPALHQKAICDSKITGARVRTCPDVTWWRSVEVTDAGTDFHQLRKWQGLFLRPLHSSCKVNVGRRAPFGFVSRARPQQDKVPISRRWIHFQGTKLYCPMVQFPTCFQERDEPVKCFDNLKKCNLEHFSTAKYVSRSSEVGFSSNKFL